MSITESCWDPFPTLPAMLQCLREPLSFHPVMWIKSERGSTGEHPIIDFHLLNPFPPDQFNLMLKKLILAFLLLGLLAAGIGFYLYFKPVKSFENASPDMSLDAGTLVKDFQADENKANSRYLNKLLQVSGTVSDISEDEKGLTNINLGVDGEMAMVSCSMDTTVRSDFSSVKSGQTVRLKGLCSGMLMDVVLVKCVLIEK